MCTTVPWLTARSRARVYLIIGVRRTPEGKLRVYRKRHGNGAIGVSG